MTVHFGGFPWPASPRRWSLGCLAGFWILTRYPNELLPGVTRAEFISAIAICVSMKALPVLGAILGEMNLLGRRIGHLALGVAGVNDVALWIVLAVLLGAASAGHAGTGHGVPLLYLLILAPIYLGVMVWLVRPALGRLVTDRMLNGGISTRAAVVVAVATLASALATDLMGLHSIIGAFVLGTIVPDKLRRPIIDCLQVTTVAVLMPFFFTLTGMRTLLDVSSPQLLEIFVVTTACSAIGIIGGTAVAARVFGETWSYGLGLGSLLQAKGLTELIVLTVLLDSKIISPQIFCAHGSHGAVEHRCCHAVGAYGLGATGPTESRSGTTDGVAGPTVLNPPRQRPLSAASQTVRQPRTGPASSIGTSVSRIRMRSNRYAPVGTLRDLHRSCCFARGSFLYNRLR